MATSNFFNRVEFNSTTSGTADFIVGAAVAGYSTPATRGVPNGALVSYTAQSADLSQWETGTGNYTTATTTIARTTIRESSIGGGKVSFNATPVVWIDAHAQDLLAIDSNITYTSPGQLTLALGTITANAQALNITGTWNASGVTFDAPIFANITNTASAANSILADIQQGGVSQLILFNRTGSTASPRSSQGAVKARGPRANIASARRSYPPP